MGDLSSRCIGLARSLAPTRPYALADAHAGPAHGPKQFVKAMQCQLREAVADLCRRRGRPFDAPVRGSAEPVDGRWSIGPLYVSCVVTTAATAATTTELVPGVPVSRGVGRRRL